MIRVFVGYDTREAIGFHVFMESVIAYSPNVAVIPLQGRQLDGSTHFTYSRFDVPRLCGYEGYALWLDGSDMIVRAPLEELFAYRSPRYAVHVVKHDYQTKHPVKYIGTPMECENLNYPRKNWSSVILWNCGHPANRTAPMIKTNPHRFSWLADWEIGDLPPEWNHLADEYGPSERAKLLHWTAGIPGFPAYENAPHAEEWLRYAKKFAINPQYVDVQLARHFNRPEVCR